MSSRPDKPGAPLRGRYLVRNRGWNAVLRATDALLARTAQADRTPIVAAPQRILIAVGGQLGDAVIATSVFPLLARAFPTAEMGILLPSWSRQIVDSHPRLRWIHHADHWKVSRAPAGRAAKWRAYQSSSAQAVREIRGVGYDIAIDLYAYYPNAAWLLWRAGVPTRIGYTSGGCGPLYTHAVDWSSTLGHTASQHVRLVRELTGESEPEEMGYELPELSTESRTMATEQISGRYVVVHPGTGDPKKAWPQARWRELIQRLEARGETVVITGSGLSERDAADTLANSGNSVLNLVGRLDWQTFRGVVSSAVAGIGADSVAMHVAAAEGTPAVVIMAAVSDPEYWRPLGKRVAVLTGSVPCAPCFRKEGCAAMSCVRDVSVDDVLDALDGLEIGEARRG